MNTVASSVVGFAFQSSASIHVTARLVDQALNLKGQTSASVYRRNFAKKRFEPCQATGLPMVRGQLSPFQCLAQNFRVRNRTITDEAGNGLFPRLGAAIKKVQERSHFYELTVTSFRVK
jgi:hypothetical protein